MEAGPEFRHLVAFVTIAEEHSFGKAALRLHITQPALSAQIKQLERWLGVTLFKRVPHGAELTQKGRNFLLYARRLLRMWHHAMKATSRKHSEAEWPLRLGYSSFISHELINEALVAYREIVPEGHLNSSSDCTARLMEMLTDGRIDAALVTFPVPTEAMFIHRICEDRLLICLRRDDPFAHLSEIPKAAIAERLQVFFNRDNHPALYDRLLRQFKKAGIELHPTETYSARSEMQFLIKTQRCFGIVREHIPLDPELIARPIAGVDLSVTTALVCYREQERPVFPMLAYRMAQQCAKKERSFLRKPPGSVHPQREQMNVDKTA